MQVVRRRKRNPSVTTSGLCVSQGKGGFDRVNRTCRRQLARIQTEPIDPEWRTLKITVLLEEGVDRSRLCPYAASESYMGDEDSQVDSDSSCEQGVVDLLSQLKEPWMSMPNATPDGSWLSAGRKGPHILQR